jgi:hypothetical protein
MTGIGPTSSWTAAGTDSEFINAQKTAHLEKNIPSTGRKYNQGGVLTLGITNLIACI